MSCLDSEIKPAIIPIGQIDKDLHAIVDRWKNKTPNQIGGENEEASFNEVMAQVKEHDITYPDVPE